MTSSTNTSKNPGNSSPAQARGGKSQSCLPLTRLPGPCSSSRLLSHQPCAESTGPCRGRGWAVGADSTWPRGVCSRCLGGQEGGSVAPRAGGHASSTGVLEVGDGGSLEAGTCWCRGSVHREFVQTCRTARGWLRKGRWTRGRYVSGWHCSTDGGAGNLKEILELPEVGLHVGVEDVFSVWWCLFENQSENSASSCPRCSGTESGGLGWSENCQQVDDRAWVWQVGRDWRDPDIS